MISFVNKVRISIVKLNFIKIEKVEQKSDLENNKFSFFYNNVKKVISTS